MNSLKYIAAGVLATFTAVGLVITSAKVWYFIKVLLTVDRVLRANGVPILF